MRTRSRNGFSFGFRGAGSRGQRAGSWNATRGLEQVAGRELRSVCGFDMRPSVRDGSI